jgi:hypothetical protein
MNINDDLEDERSRAEDIILGSLGYGLEAKILWIKETNSGFVGKGKWLSSSEEFDFKSDGDLLELEIWALDVLLSNK